MQRAARCTRHSALGALHAARGTRHMARCTRRAALGTRHAARYTETHGPAVKTDEFCGTLAGNFAPRKQGLRVAFA